MTEFSTMLIPNVIENLDLGPSQSPGIGRSNLAPISNRGDDSIAPIAGAFASVLNQTFSHVGYMQHCAVFSCQGMGDGLISLVLSNNLHLNGAEATTFHPFLNELS